MTEKNHVHIVSFDIPFPANYGGVIDVFYKIKYLSERNIKVHLHCFEYGRNHSQELEKLCESVNYYPRQTGIKSHLSLWPFIVKSRSSKILVQNLQKDNYPILFEGMHTMGVGLDPSLANRLKIYRESNIEHQYYYHLCKNENKLSKKLFFYLESLKLLRFEKNIKQFDCTLVVSQSDEEYLKQKYPNSNIQYLPSFHSNLEVQSEKGTGTYALYNGNLSVNENIEAVNYLIDEVFSKTEYPFIIAGLSPSTKLQKKISLHKNISLHANLSDVEMSNLIQNAQFNILTTSQATGLKLKLLNTLFQGRFCIVNDKMVKGTGLSELCIIANNAQDILDKIEELKNTEFTDSFIDERKLLIQKSYSNKDNIQKLLKYCFPA